MLYNIVLETIPNVLWKVNHEIDLTEQMLRAFRIDHTTLFGVLGPQSLTKE